MVEAERKSPEEIKQKILEALNEKPMNALEISKQIGSNWSTVKSYVEELVKGKNIREITLGNQTFYQRITEDTYFNIPLTKEEREIFYFLFNNARKLFREQGREPTKTDMNKTVVRVIDELHLQAPTVWYLYGKMALLRYEPEKDYTSLVNIGRKEKILPYLTKVVLELSKKKNSHEVREQQYTIYGQDFYMLKENFYTFLIASNLDREKQKLIDFLSEFFLMIPTKKEFLKISTIVYNYGMLIRKMTYLGSLQEYKKNIVETFDAIWKAIALYSFYESLSKYSRFNNKEVLSLYLESAINIKTFMAQDSIIDLEEIYLSKLKEMKEPPKMQSSPETKILSDILFEMAKEGIENE